MRSTVTAACAVLALSALGLPARADSCSNLWYQRNAIYKAAGYCFKTGPAIQTFGNAGCQYDQMEDVPLSQNDRRAVASIVREERMMGCQ